MKIHKVIIFRIVKPVDIRWEEIGGVIQQLQREIVPLYNKAAVNMYQRILNPIPEDEGKMKIQTWSTDLVYHPIQETIHSSYLSLGLTIKIKASFEGSKARDMLKGIAGVPTITTKEYPLVFYQQNGFKFTLEENKENSMYDDFFIDIPFPQWEEKKEIDKYKPWQKYTFSNKKRQKVVGFLLSTKTRDYDEEIIEKIASGEIKVSTIELANKNNKWLVRISISYEEEPQIKLNENRTGTVTFGIEHPLEFSIKGKTLKIKKNLVEIVTRKQLGRLREQKDQNMRGGHGVTDKFKSIKLISDKYRQRRKKIVEKWVYLGNRFFVRNNIGSVKIIEPDIEKKKENTQEAILLRLNWNPREIQNKLIAKLERSGIKII